MSAAWLAEMPPAHCPKGCVVRRGDVLGVVTWNDGEGGWTVIEFNETGDADDQIVSGQPTPEAAGWRHALDHRSGFDYVFTEYLRGTTSAQRDTIPDWGAIGWRHTFGKTTDTDRLQLARNYAALLLADS